MTMTSCNRRRLDGDVFGLGRRAVAQQRAQARRERARGEALVGRGELVERPPAVTVDVLGGQIDRRHCVVPVDVHEVEALALPPQAPIPRKDVLAQPHQWADLRIAQARLLEQLAAESGLVALAGLDTTARSR